MREDRPELKHRYEDLVITPPMSVEVFPTTSVQHICGLTQGVNGDQRLGNKVNGSHINFNFHLVNFDNATQRANSAARVMVVIDKKSNQVDIGANAAVLSDLMQVSSVNGQYLDPDNMRNEEYRKRFVILYDKVIEVAGITTAASLATDQCSTGNYVTRRLRLKCKHKQIYDTNNPNGSFAATAEGTIWLIYKPQQLQNLGVLQPAPQMHAFIDYFYTDA